MNYLVRRNTSNILNRVRIFSVSTHFLSEKLPHGQLLLVKYPPSRILPQGQLSLNSSPWTIGPLWISPSPGQLLPGPLAPAHFSLNNLWTTSARQLPHIKLLLEQVTMDFCPGELTLNNLQMASEKNTVYTLHFRNSNFEIELGKGLYIPLRGNNLLCGSPF